MRIRTKHVWWFLLAVQGLFAFFGKEFLPTSMEAAMDFLTAVDLWIINHAAYPGLFAVFLGLVLGTVIIPEVWPFFKKRYLKKGAKEFRGQGDKHVMERIANADIPEADTPGVEITPAMIEAGASVLCGFNTYFAGEEYWAEKVYRAMAKVALRKRRGSVLDE